MWSTQTFNEQIPGYYNNPLDYQSNLINGSGANIYSHTSSTKNESSPNLVHSPISEDEFSTAKRKRKGRNTRKVEIEKKRRDRINYSLEELRRLVPEANEKQGSAKLEKAEILKMTVEHLTKLNAKGFDTFSFDPHTFATKYYVNGFRECAEQVAQYLKSAEGGFGFNEPLKLRLVNHLHHYITQREYELKAGSSNGLGWNPNLFILPTTTNQTTLTTNNSSILNTTAPLTTNAQQMLNNSVTSSSPITTLTPSSLSNHSNSSVTSNSSSSNYQQINQQQQQQNDSTSTSPLCESPNPNNSSLNNSQLNSSNQLNASQLLSQHSYTDNNNNTSTSSNSSNNSLHSDSSSGHSTNQTSAANLLNSNDERGNLLSNNLLNVSGSIMGPPPPPLQKVAVFNGVLPPSANTAELTYTSMSNMHPSNNSPYSHHTHSSSFIKMEPSPITTNNYAATAYANHIHNTQSYFNSALAYGTVGQKMNGASVVNVLQPNASQANSQQYIAAHAKAYCRPWNPSEIVGGTY